MLIAVCEDNREERDAMKCLIENFFRKRGVCGTVYLYPDGESLLLYAADIMFDVVLLDIYLPGSTGIFIANTIKRLNPRCNIIFTTVSSDFALTAYGIGAVHYLVKPVSSAEVEEALERCRPDGREGRRESMLSIISNRKRIVLGQSGIFYIESRKKLILLHTSSGDYPTWMPMQELFCRLDGEIFTRLQRSFIANMDYIVEIRNRECRLKDGTSISVSRRDSREIQEKYKRYLFQRLRDGEG